MRVACEWTEEEIIDLILSEEDRDASLWRRFDAHLPFCQHCRFLYDYWVAFLSNSTTKVQEATAHRQREQEAFKEGESERSLSEPSNRLSLGEIKPPPRTKARLFHTLFNESQTKKRRRKQASIVTLTAVMTFFLLFISLGSLSKPVGEKNTPTIIPRQTLENYQVIPVSQGMVKGTIWLNRANDDLLLFLNGVHPIVDHDYQVWMMTPTNRPLNGGLLDFSHGNAQLKIHGPSLSNVHTLMISLEPSGGSANPTGPRTMTVDLKD